MEDSEQQEPIFELATECENLYASQITKLNDVGDQNASRLLSDVYQRFAAWAAFLGVFAEAKVCLDRRLRRHVEIQDQVLRLLGIMQRNLSKLFDDSVSMDGDNIQSIAQHAPLSQHRAVNVQSLEAISAALQRLHQLATAIQRSSVTSQTLKARELAATFDLTYFEQVANLLIRTLYTEASACLIELLTQSMAETYALFLHRKRRQQQLQTRRLAPQAPLSLALIAEETDGFDGSVVMDSEQEALHVQDDSSSNMVPAPPPLRLSHVPQSEPTSLDCQELNAHIRRLTSVSARSKPISILDNQADYPQPAQDSLSCQWCFAPLTPDCREKTKWQKHVNEDFKPYVCLSMECSETMPRFASSRQWLQHMASSHGPNWHRDVQSAVTWLCPICSDLEHGFDNPGSLSEHFDVFHAGIFTAQQMRPIVRQSMYRFPRAQGTCPLCCLQISDDRASWENHEISSKVNQEGKHHMAQSGDSKPKRFKTDVGFTELSGDNELGANGVRASSTKSMVRDTSMSRGPDSTMAVGSHVAAHLQNIFLLTLRLISIDGVGGSSAESGSESSQTNHQTSWVSTEPRSLDRAMSDMWSEPLPEMGGDLHPDNVAYTMEDVPDSDPIDWHDILGSPIHTAENAHGHAINMGPLHRPAPLIQDNNTETSARGIVSRPAGRKFPIDVDDDDFMVIGIDFGTTYSGVSWATVADFTRNKINLITSWPGTDREEGKAPTELFYEDNQIFWGYEIPDGADPVRWFKLLLVKNEDLSEETRSSELILRGRKMLKETGKTVVGLIADYLRLLWSHILKHLKKSRGEFVVNALRFHVVITIPAIWKGYARQGMEEAARQAGLLSSRPAGETTLSFVLEPEAAALSTLCEPGHQAQPGDLYVICDAGGGTVDLISYKITSVNPIVMHEAVEGTGGLCGGILIDEAFERACKSRLGRLWNHLSKAGIKEIVKDQWENAIKPQFKPQSSKKEYTVSIPAEAFRENSLDDMNREPYIKKGRIHFSSLHIQEAFTETFAAIDKLIDGQINKAKSQSLTIKGIILVGGLGASPYLYEHLKDRHASTGITILQSGGMRPRTAICQGAVYKGFLSSSSSDSSGAQQTNYSIAAPISVISTISRTSLGVVYKTPFDSSKHLKKDKFWYPHEGEWFAEKQIKWYLKRGDNISTTNPLRHSFYHLYEHEFYGSFTVELFRCEKQDPPTRLDKSVVRHCKIDCTLDVPWEQLEDFISANTGTMIKKMSFDLEMVPSGASVLFVVYINGRWQGSQIANVRF